MCFKSSVVRDINIWCVLFQRAGLRIVGGGVREGSDPLTPRRGGLHV